jgi:transcription antitermination factor NusG
MTMVETTQPKKLQIGDFVDFIAKPEKREDSIDLRHHVLLTEPNLEFKARDYLHDELKFDPYVPSEDYVAFRDITTMFGVQRRKIEGTRPIFRGYLFLPLNVAWSFGPIYQTPGLRRNGHPFMTHNGRHVVLPDYEIEKFAKLEYAINHPEAPILPFKVGDRVRIVDDAFMDMVLRVKRIDDEERIELMGDILGGRDVSFFVKAFQIVAVD